MDKKLQKIILEYIKNAKEVTKGQVINTINKQNNYERINVQEAINLLIDKQLISRVGIADTLTLTNAGHEIFAPWHKRINWSYYTIKIFSYTVVFLLGLFAEEIKNWMIKLF